MAMAEKLDLNRATATQIEKITGISRTLARKIVAERNARGGFSNLAELREIDEVDDDLIKTVSAEATLSSREAAAPPAQARINLDPEGKNQGRYAGYKATADFSVKTVLEDGSAPIAVAGSATGYFDANGALTLNLPALALIDSSLKFTVREPGGSIVATKEFPKADLANAIALAVTPTAPPTTQPTEAPTFGKPSRLRGRVLDRGGRVQISGKQVIIWGATVDQPQDADFIALAVAKTDGSGYFSTPYPLGEFTNAHATVALERVGAVPIHLTDDRTFPGDVILVVEAPASSHDEHEDECGCGSGGKDVAVLRNPDADDLVNGGGFSSDIGQGKCVDFTRPDRTLQEFSYSYVVRTTEPSIKGMTLQEPPKLPPGLWQEVLSLASIKNAGTNALMLRSDVAGGGVNAVGVNANGINTAAAAGTVEFSPNAELALRALNRPEKIAVNALQELSFSSKYQELIHAIGKLGVFAPERSRMDCRHAVDWDLEPTIYQACTIAHGHILDFKQEWIADGYSMGRLLYSLPLAPGQKKQIAVLDWERRESAIRQESLEEEESLTATLSRDRDIGEMVNSVLTESSRGGSSANTSSFGGGLGIGAILGPVGGLLGVGGGASNANSTAWQNSSRDVAANSLQTLRDRTSQAAAAMRAQRSTVVQSVAQGERVSVTTETVANYNHCHAMTMEYFEVLRHLIVRQRLVDVQECLFVPLQMSRFDRAKALRWLHTLQPTMPTRDLREGFNALERIDNNYDGSNLPVGRYADQPLDYVEGDLSIRFQLARPRDKDDDFDPVNWGWLAKLIPSLSAEEQYKTFLKDQQFKDRIFLEQLGPRIASAFVDLMRFSWIDENDAEHALPIDTTLLSNFVNDRVLSVSLRLDSALNGIARKSIKYIKISEFAFIGGIFVPLFDVLPGNSRVIVEGGNMSYRTQFSSDYLFRSGNIRNDLTGSDAVRIYTPLNAQELRNPREEDKERARRLLDHLNENIERYHHVLWWRMSPDRRYMLLDGFEAPNSGGRSVASVVENRLIGIVGNSLIMPVARGFHLDPTFKQDIENPIDLLEHYQPNTPIEPVRVAIPTRGVYAEAVMGACNSCEVKEEERFWRWEESPIPDNPPAILPTSTDTRRADPGSLEAKDFPAPIIAMQNAPAAPDPTGLGAALNLLGTPNLFKDITGLEGNQRNALEALKASLSTAQAFGDKAANLALQAKMSKDIDKTMRAINDAKSQGLLSDEQAKSLTQGAIQSMIGAGPTTDPKPLSTNDVEQLTQSAGANGAAVKVSRPSGEEVSVDARPSAQDSPRALIVLGADTATGTRRAFNPATHSITGEAALSISVRNAPAGYTVKWLPSEADTLDVVSPTAESTVVKAKRPGKTRLDVAVFDGSTQIASTRLNICVPQFVTIDEDAGAFSGVLAQLKIDGRKADVLREARTTCIHLLRTANVRTVWKMAPFGESVPAHIAAALQTTATIKGEPPAADPNLFGVTRSSATGMGAASFNETIELFPGAYDNPVAGGSENMVDTESQAILMQIQSEAAPSADLLDFAVKVFGRMIGETLAHEIVHSLLGTAIDPNFHNSPKIANDLMNSGFDRSFRQRTGIEDTAFTSPVIPSNFIDHGVGAIGGLQARNQGLIDAVFPVPPSFT
jgi:hypothetical protein